MVRRIRTACLVTLTLGGALVLGASAYAQPQAGTRYKDWVVRCENVAVAEGSGSRSVDQCFIAQSRTVDRKDDASGASADGEKVRVLEVLIGYHPTKRIPVATVWVNAGVGGFVVPGGMQLSVGEGPSAKLDYQFCNRAGCQASIEQLPQSLITQMKNGVEASLRVHNGQRWVPIPISLLGFTAGLRAVTP